MAQAIPPTSEPSQVRPLTRLFSIAMVVATWCLLFVGAMVTSTNSGLSVPDWPTTFGHNMFLYPLSQMRGGIFFEHGHRLFASAVGFLALVNAIFLGGRSPRPALRYTSYFALLLVIAQGVLGGLTVRMKLPMPVSSAHGGMAQLFFLTTLFIAVLASKSWAQSHHLLFSNGRAQAQVQAASFDWRAPGVVSALFFLGLGYLQILIGAVMRHSYAGLAIPTFPKAFGAWWPSFWNFGLVVHVLHTRIMPMVLTLACLWVLRANWRSPQALVRRGAYALLALFTLQVVLGATVIWSYKAPIVTSLHVATGAGVLGSALFIALWAGRLTRKGSMPQAQSSAASKGDAVWSEQGLPPRIESAPA